MAWCASKEAYDGFYRITLLSGAMPDVLCFSGVFPCSPRAGDFSCVM